MKKTFPPGMTKSMECPAGEGIEMNGGLNLHPISLSVKLAENMLQ
jgi:hypothetical protein